MNKPGQSVPHPTPAARLPLEKPDILPLFKNYPRLGRRLPHVSLGRFPTPVEKLERVGNTIGLNHLYIKRDDLSGAVYGGNKVRKLEFLLGDALRRNAKEVITFGFAGSNHALATAIYASRLELGSTSLLLPQVNAHYVRRNLLASHYFKADLRYYENWTFLGLGLLRKLLRGGIKHGTFPRVIPGGGSCPLGVSGYVNAALELKEQIIAGEMPEPDLIYVPLGSMGTAVGLTLGLKAAGLKCRIIAIRVIEERFANAKKMARLFQDTASFLRKLDPAFPKPRLGADDWAVRDDCLGGGYACFTEKAMKAASLMREKSGIILNGTYSAKALSALFDDAEKQVLKGKTVLFWNTYNSRDLSTFAAGVDYHQLPEAFHRYFEEDVQTLDRAGFDR
jgi:1-aminocyclopropane-1-carboxylate deaminase/D-cysteine desulfhydrase-like pyridoxal-dependent ACC family enzyme